MTYLDTVHVAHGQGFRLREAVHADAQAMAQICTESFASGPIARGLHGQTGSNDAGRTSMQEGMEKDLIEQSTGSVRYVVAELISNPIDTVASTSTKPHPVQIASDNGKIIGFAKWHFHLDTAQSTTIPMAVSSSALGEGTDLSLAQAFFGGCHELRQRYIQPEGQPHCILSILVVNPAMQGLGAGSALLRWGTDYAGQEGWDCWLTSTPAGYWVYRKHGFVDIDIMDLDLCRWGVCKTNESEDWGEKLGIELAGVAKDGSYRVVLMRRRAVGRVGVINDIAQGSNVL